MFYYRPLQPLFERYPRASAAVYLLCSVIALLLVIRTVREYRAYPDKPASLSLKDAAALSRSGSVWVSISDAVWKCGEALHFDHNDVIPITNPPGTVLALFYPDHHPSDCNALQAQRPVGVLEPMTIGEFNVLSREKFPILTSVPRKDIFILNNGAGPGDSFLGIIFSAVFLAIMLLGFFGFMERARRNKSTT